ncbi:hypothetical protein STFR1_30213 [Bacillus vallismortis]
MITIFGLNVMFSPPYIQNIHLFKLLVNGSLLSVIPNVYKKSIDPFKECFNAGKIYRQRVYSPSPHPTTSRV